MFDVAKVEDTARKKDKDNNDFIIMVTLQIEQARKEIQTNYNRVLDKIVLMLINLYIAYKKSIKIFFVCVKMK